MPYLDCAVFGTGNQDRQRRVEDSEGNIGSVGFKSLDAGFGVVIPDLDQTVHELHDLARGI